MPTESYKDSDTLYEMYWGDGLKQVEIANKLGCNAGSVSYWMDKHNIQTRSGSEAIAGEKLNVSKHHHKILTGILMSDGNAVKDRTTSIEVSMVTESFIRWLDSELDEISTGVYKREFDNKQDNYRIRTRSLEDLNKYRQWYSTGKKVWPDDITLYPETLKMLYVGDGTRAKYPSGTSFLKICLKNEHKNKEKINSMFEKIGVTPRWHGYSIEFKKSESDYLWNYMGSPPPGFQYKWPESIR